MTAFTINGRARRAWHTASLGNPGAIETHRYQVRLRWCAIRALPMRTYTVSPKANRRHVPSRLMERTGQQ